ncbi:ferredoxin [Streptomyces buecherae]|uniref:Ferredoxin n=1 Tax=Streptomyces buecherae TaxID=2763006 RepID=A0A7G8K6E5_9ACTN|nr:ferredoxin [Streptomyces buecherae]MBC3987266.1 ferredoxin [Streptomyces buecherae]QKW53917.1 ferredoxin [Streptomyces buecherae]QNJ38628.1 ferredoxin [Streptomyces buecherae]
MKVRVDEDACVASGMCAYLAPAVFDQREDDGVVVVLHEVPDEGQYEAVQDAVRNCPARVISVEDADDPTEG